MADIATKAFSGRDIHNNRVTVLTSAGTGSVISKEDGLNIFISPEVLDTRLTDRLNDGRALFFSKFSVNGQSNVVADKVSDTLNLVAGANITITTDPLTDTITISGT